MPLICGIDLETSGLSAQQDRIVECAAVLYDWNTATPLVLQSSLVFAGVTLSQELINIHGITNEMLELYGESEESVFGQLHALMTKADYVMAHFGGEFDRLFCRETFARLNIDWPDKTWVDTSCDIMWPEKITTRNLAYLAAEAGFVPPYKHRALFDVLTMLKVASDFDLDKMVARALEPTVYVQALVSFEEKDKAKDNGFRWLPAPAKIWWASRKISDYEAEKDSYGFRTILLSGKPE